MTKTFHFNNDKQCSRGHDLELVGRDKASGLCNACAAGLRRIRAKQDKGPNHAKTANYQAIEAIRTNNLLELYDKKNRAETAWERDHIQRQIDELR